jgi:hypothetical protein
MTKRPLEAMAKRPLEAIAKHGRCAIALLPLLPAPKSPAADQTTTKLPPTAATALFTLPTYPT